MNTVTSEDGTLIAYQSTGAGPDLILIPGALTLAHDFAGLAHELSAQFTVHVMERRGRGESGPQGANYSIDKECSDLSALQRQTGAAYVFGHSFGGFLALETARNNPAFQKIAIYEPGVSINSSINMAWIPRCQAEVRAHKYHAAFTTFVKGLDPQSAKLPHAILSFILRFAIRKVERQQKYALLAGTIVEHQEEARLNNTYTSYSQIQAQVLCMYGEKSGATPHRTADTLAATLQKAEVISFPNLNHLAPESQPKMIAPKLISFFSA